MSIDDVIYLLLLVLSIGFGHIFRNIPDRNFRQNATTLIGVFIVLITSGRHIVHPLFCVFVNWFIITFFNKRIVHVLSFAFSFLYLIFFRTTEYFGIPYPPSHTNLIQMILTLKLVGLAYEVHDSAVDECGKPNPELECSRVAKPSFADVFQYSFCYMGVLTGPYFSYRAYWDLFNAPFGDHAQCASATYNRIKFVPLYCLGFLLSSSIFPHSYVESAEYINECSLVYRLWYILPCFFTFRMRMYIGMRLSECVLIMAGLGAYPASTLPKPGRGPTTNHSALVAIAADPSKVMRTEYSFATVYNIEPWGAELDYSVRSSMKNWNMTVQYWLAAYVFKRFPIKAYRMPVTFLVSSFWHGMYAGHYMCLCSVPFYLPIEDIYINNFKRISPNFMGKLGFAVCYTWRMLLMGYWGMAFVLLYVRPALTFWASVYFIPTLITIIMYFLSFFIFPKSNSTVTFRTSSRVIE